MEMAHGSGDRKFLPLNIAVLTVSDSRTEADDKSGKTLVDRLTATGHLLAEKVIEPDDCYRIRATVSRWIADPDVQVVITTGGTGLTGRDGTPEAIEILLDKVIDGFGELFRSLSFQDIGTSTLQSRAIAGVARSLSRRLGQADRAPARCPHPAVQPGRDDAPLPRALNPIEGEPPGTFTPANERPSTTGYMMYPVVFTI